MSKQFSLGANVILSGLSSAQYNNKTGVICGNSDGRYQVELSLTGEQISVKASNMDIMAGALATNVGPLRLDCCVYNASGPRTQVSQQLAAIGRSSAGAVTSKSATLDPREGNPFPRYKEKFLESGHYACGSINSEGLPNRGIDYYTSEETVNAIIATKKPYILSISGLSLENNLKMLAKIVKVQGIAAIELNLACPNIPNKPVMGYDFEQMEHVLKSVESAGVFSEKAVGLKLPPYFDAFHFEQAAAVMNKFPIAYVVCTNTAGNGLVVDPIREETAIAPRGGFGGLAGGFIKHIALANVWQFNQLLRDDIDIVGCGGVTHGTDVFELILCGAKAVQVGTIYRAEGPKCFNRIAKELYKIMEQRGYKSIEQFRGKLKAPGKGRHVTEKEIEMMKRKEAGEDVEPNWTMYAIFFAFFVALVAIVMQGRLGDVIDAIASVVTRNKGLVRFDHPQMAEHS